MVLLDIPIKNATSPLRIPTFDGSGQAVHPDVVKIKREESMYILAFTPYPYSNEKYEKPSILVSQDGISWYENGIKNPIIRSSSSELTSDPDIVYANGRFYLYYVSWRWGGKLFKKAKAILRQYTKQYFSSIKVIISKDLRNWYGPIQVLKSGGVSSFLPFTRLIVSPAITWDGVFRMWYVKVLGCTNTNPHIYYRESLDGVRWSKEKNVYIKLPKNDVLWHIDVEKLSNNHYWMIIAAYPESTHCQNIKNLYLAVSDDGLKWKTFEKPLLTTESKGSWDSDSLYRSTFLVENGMFHLWYPGLRGRIWRIGYTCTKIPILDERIHSLNVVEAK